MVATNSLGIADSCKTHGAAILTDGSPEELARAVLRVFDGDGVADRLRLGGISYLRAELDVEAVAARLESIYRAAVGTGT